ncbi:MAG: type II toxin-antitoxin system Phd/YefM family antitoxin [Gemmatimonadetes bacterium]|jgi:prevent-host-death family protein|nr:type II toxin-antitoxin system Phd/YefM family antitoxin [Gemmatimonadota bacterium]
MQITNIHQAKTQLSKLIERVLLGEEIVIARAGKPVAKLVPYQPNRQPRQGGQWRGKVEIAADFDQLPDELTAAFRGEKP